jgi:hypothetical protein
MSARQRKARFKVDGEVVLECQGRRAERVLHMKSGVPGDWIAADPIYEIELPREVACALRDGLVEKLSRTPSGSDSTGATDPADRLADPGLRSRRVTGRI